MDLKENCAKYVAFLRSLYLIHQNHHWLASGASFYGNHLLFERIYKSAAENADLAAEKFIGLFGSEALGVAEQPKLIHDILENHTASNSNLNSLIAASIDAEKEFVAFAEDFYNQLKQSDQISIGLDDMVMGISSDRETSLYLLQQANSGEKKMSKLNEVAAKFQRKLAQVAAAPQAPNLTPEQVATKQEEMKLQDAGVKVLSSLAEALGMQAQSEDLKFTELKLLTDSTGKAISWKLSVSPQAADQFRTGVSKLKQSNPSFAVGTYVGQLFSQLMPGVRILPAQPISIG